MASAQPSPIHTRMWKSEWQHERAAPRRAVNRESTIRGNDRAPHDSLIQDLSLTGFRIVGPVRLKAGDEIMVGLAGVGIREAVVMWSDDETAGCQFVQSISQAEMDRTLIASTVIESSFASSSKRTEEAAATTPDAPRRLSARRRAAIVLMAALAAWGAWIAIAGSLVALVWRLL